MPAAILPDEGIGDQLSYILNAPIAGVLPWTFILWVNDLDPSAATVLADLEEATWDGYSRQTLTRGGWTTPDVNNGCASSTYGTDPIVFVPTGPAVQTNYGAAYIDQSSGVIRWVQRFEDADIVPVIVGQAYKILPQYTLTSAECSEAKLAARRAARRNRKR